MHRVLFAVFLATLVAPLDVSARSWQSAAHKGATPWYHFSDKKLGFAFRYPPNWRLTNSNLPTTFPKSISLSYQGTTTYALTASLLALPAGRLLGDTLNRFIATARSNRSTLVATARWARTSLGGIPSMVTIVKGPPTEGGVTVSNAIYIARWRARVYEITLFCQRRPAPSSLTQFPSVYLHILSTWRFI